MAFCATVAEDLSFSETTTEFRVDHELVRGSEDTVLTQLVPLVREESVALNLSGVERIDAAGIAALITLYCTSAKFGNEFWIVEPSPRVRELLKLVGLDSILMRSSPALNPRAPQVCSAA